MARIITRGVIDWATLKVLEQDSYEYEGPIAHAKSSGSPPAAVDPYQAAGAQYGLSTGTANYNAALGRTNSSNPLGSSTWSVNGYGPYQASSLYPQGSPQQGFGGASGAGAFPGVVQSGYGDGSYTPANNGLNMTVGGSGIPIYTGQGQPTYSGQPPTPTGQTQPNFGHANNYGQGTPAPGQGGNQAYPSMSGTYASGAYSSDPKAAELANMETQQPPNYTQTTQLLPWAQNALQSPINTSGIAGMPGGPSTTQDLNDTRNALYNEQQAYIAPEQQLQSEQLQSQLANEGITPGSAAYNNEMDRMNRSQTFANQQSINNAITGGGAEQSRLFGLGAQSLQDQMSVRDAPISEYNALQPGGGGGGANAQTPDISGAFSNQLNSQLAGYNANTATNNANTGAAAGLISSYLMYLALA